MTKGLEALSKNIRYKKEHIRDDFYRLYIKKNELELLEKELQRLEFIDNAKPSEALERYLETLLERANHDELLFRKDTKYCENFLKENQKYYDTIKQALIKAEEDSARLEFLTRTLDFTDGTIEATFYNKDIEVIAMPYERYETKSKKELAFDIIKKKNVDVFKIKEFIVLDVPKVYNLDYYNEHLWKRKHQKKLTQEEFDILIEVLQ